MISNEDKQLHEYLRKSTYIQPKVYLYEILVPCNFQDNGKPVRTVHHKKWDEKVRAISGGLTVLTPVKGQWIHEEKLYEDRVIPVRVMCTKEQILSIIDFTIKHYRQKAVMAYKLSDEVLVRYEKNSGT